jgi:hypothetical protein
MSLEAADFGADPNECVAMVGFNPETSGNDALRLAKYLHNTLNVPTFCTGRWCPKHPGHDWRESTADGATTCKYFIMLVTGDAKDEGECWQRSANNVSAFKNLVLPRWESGACTVIPVFYDAPHPNAVETPDPSKVLRWISSLQPISRGYSQDPSEDLLWLKAVARGCAPEKAASHGLTPDSSAYKVEVTKISFHAEKKGAIIPSWKRRYFVCDKQRRQITYWSSEYDSKRAAGQAKPKGVMNIVSVSQQDAGRAIAVDQSGRVFYMRNIAPDDLSRLVAFFQS